MKQLAKYEAARRALAEAHRVDEVKDIRDKAAAMEHYALQAKDRELIEMATDIKFRAERRAGELLRELPKNRGGIAGKTGIMGKPLLDPTPKLSDIGVTKLESWRWQKLAKMPEKDFEEKLTGLKSDMRAKTEGGKPKSKGKRGKFTPKLDKARNIVRPKIEAGEIISTVQLEQQYGISHVTFETAIAAEQGRQEAIVEKAALDPAFLSKTAQEKLDIAVRAHKRKLDLGFELRVQDEVKRRIDQIILPHWKEKIAKAQELYARRRGLMNKDTFNTIRRGLHPDSRNAISDKKLGEAFDTFMSLEKYLLNEKDSPTDFSGLPGSWEEWEAAKRKAMAMRRAKRGTNVVRPR